MKTKQRVRTQWVWLAMVGLALLVNSMGNAPASLAAASVVTLRWTTVGALPSPSGGLAATTDGRYVYVSGGYNGAFQASVYSAPLVTHGHMTRWRRLTPLPTRLYDHSMVTYEGSLYAIGGTTNGLPSRATSMVYRTRLQSDGTAGHWVLAGYLPTRLYGGAAIVHGDMLYVLGGYSPQVGYLASVYAMQLGSRGFVGTWKLLTRLPRPLFGLALAVSHKTLFVVGGSSSPTVVSAMVYAANFAANGGVGRWQAGPALPKPLSYASAVIVANHLMVLGGSLSADLTKPIKTVYVAGIGPNGTPGPWHPATALSAAMAGGVAISSSSFVYAIGGYVGQYYSVAVNATCPSFIASCPR